MRKNIVELPILAIETSGELCSVALLNENDVLFEINIKKKNVHSEMIFRLISEALELSSLSVDDLKAVAVSSGPGSFTGLRIGMSAAKGIAFGANLPVIPVPTFDALAWQIYSLSGLRNFAIANVVNVTELYYADYNFDENMFKNKTIIELIGREDLVKRAAEKKKFFGNNGQNKDNQSVSAPNAAFIADWAYIFGKDLLTFKYDYLEPDYIKKFVARIKK